MGIAISELLTLDYFRGFKVLAGSAGLSREVQGVTVLDAPDSFRWMKGKEMILTSGYVLAQDPECMERCAQEGFLTQMACLVIKAGRYLTPVPQRLIQIFEENGIALLEAPFSVAYMELMYQVNIAIMNKTTKRFCISRSDTYSLGDDTYKERKLRRILQAVEVEMRFPALLHDLGDGQDYFSSPNFRRIADAHHLTTTDFWEPGFPCSRHTLCDSLHMARYRVVEESGPEQPRFSWITVPISFSGSVQAYFVVMESRELMDYYDEYAIRIATMLLQSVYEQLIVAKSVGNIGFENLMHFALSDAGADASQLIAQAGALNFNVNETYCYAVFERADGERELAQHRESVWDELRLGCPGEELHFAFLQSDQCLLMLGSSNPGRAPIRNTLEELRGRLEKRLDGAQVRVGYFDQPGTLLEANRNIRRCRQALRLGAVLYPQRNVWSYTEFGPLAWLEPDGGEMELMCREFRGLLDEPGNQELLRTLKVYLACNMNFSETAEKLYVHVNTVRKRIERVNDLTNVDWKDSFARMRLELLLELLRV